MRAWVHRRYGGPDGLVLAQLPAPQPGPGEVAIAVRAAAVNDHDWGLLRGVPRVLRIGTGLFRPRVPVLGCDLAGEVCAVGPGSSALRPGDRVHCDVSEHGFGAFAECVCVPQAVPRRIPDGMSFEEAAALPHASSLALQALLDTEPLRDGERILFNGAGGGVGTLGLQFARQRDVEITCVDAAEKLGMLRELGADHVIDYRTTEFTRTGRRWDRIVDTRTSRGPGAHARALADGGSYATVGGSLRHIAWMLARRRALGRPRGLRFHLVVLRANRHLERMTALHRTGGLRVPVDGPVPFEALPEALARFGAARHLGKLVVRVA